MYFRVLGSVMFDFLDVESGWSFGGGRTVVRWRTAAKGIVEADFEEKLFGAWKANLYM